MRDEHKDIMNRASINSTGLSDDNLERLKQLLTLDNVNDLEYLAMVLNEAMRINNPVHASTFYIALTDIKAGGLSIRKGDKFYFNMTALHHNKNQWPKPYEFIPERFDHTSPMWLTSDGKKRVPASFAPFTGGQRICFGKTFAE